MLYPKYAMFFDNHTMQACPDVGHDFDADAFAGELKKAGVNLVGFHAKCNQGFCYFNTSTGIRHPSLPAGKDLFGEVIQACNKQGIQVSAYLNCGLSNEDAIRHPEWSRVGMNGEILHPEVYDIGWVSPYIRTMCPNSPWRDYLMTLIREVKEQYPVAGFLFDSFNVFPCVCPHCVAEMKKLGLDPKNEEDVMSFAAQSERRLAEDISALLEPKKNGYLLYFLGIGTKDNARLGTYLECECLPTNPCWGYDYLPLMSRFFRKMTDGPVLNMTGRFYDWGDFGSLRAEAAIEYDLLYGLANGMRPNIGDHFYPSGKLNSGMFKRIQKVFNYVQQYDKWFENAVPQVDIGVVLPDCKMEKNSKSVGMTRLFSELKLQFEFATPENDWSPYKLLVFMESSVLSSVCREKLQKHLDAGGSVWFAAGLCKDENGKYLFEKEAGVSYAGEEECDPVYFSMNAPYDDNMPDLPLWAGKKYTRLNVAQDTVVLGQLVMPYYKKHWDGKYAYFYAPPHEKSDLPFATLSQQRVACSAISIFDCYYEKAATDIKQAAKNILKILLEKPLLKLGDSMPSFARAFVTEQNGSILLHLLNYLPELRGKMLIVEERLKASNVRVSLRLDGKQPKQVRLCPTGTELPFEINDGYVSFIIPEIEGYALAQIIF